MTYNAILFSFVNGVMFGILSLGGYMIVNWLKRNSNKKYFIGFQIGGMISLFISLVLTAKYWKDITLSSYSGYSEWSIAVIFTTYLFIFLIGFVWFVGMLQIHPKLEKAIN